MKLESNPETLQLIGLSEEEAKRYKEMGKSKFRGEFESKVRDQELKAENELREKKAEKKDSKWGNICCAFFLIIFLFALVYNKINEEFWNVYKTRGTEIVDYYEALKLDQAASISSIKKAYRKLAI